MSAQREEAERMAAWLLPISPAAPAGEDARFDPEHEQLRMEVAKLTDVHGANPDWAKVERDGQKILTTRSKDLLIATYVCAALLERHGYVGLIDGLNLVLGLLTTVGASLHPLRVRARANALSWLLERIERALSSHEPKREEWLTLRELLTALRATSSELLADDAPSFVMVIKALERVSPNFPTAADPVEKRANAEGQIAQPSAMLPAAENWLRPISLDSPTGTDTTYEEAHVLARQEVEKLQALRGESPDWQSVFHTCDQLLRVQSKDLVLAAYFAAAAFELHGAAGLVLGLRVFADLSERFWEGCWPALVRLKKRQSAARWLIERVVAVLRRHRWSGSERAALAEVHEALTHFEAVSTARFGLSPDEVKALREAVDATASVGAEGIRSTEATTAPAKPIVASVERETRSESQSLAGGADVGGKPVPTPLSPAPLRGPTNASSAPSLSVDALPEESAKVGPYLHRVGAALIELGSRRYQADRTETRAYRLLRAGLWLALERLPPSNAKGRTEVHPPSRSLVQEAQAAIRAEHWEAALDRSEGILRKNPFWLEGHLLSASALERMGEAYGGARAVIEAEARAFVLKHPRCVDLQFADGAPMCPPAVVSWLALNAKAVGSTAVDAEPPNASTTSAPPSNASAPVDARSTTRGRTLDDATTRGLAQADPAAVARLQERLQACRSARERFQLRLELARALEAAGRMESAGALWLGLSRDVEQHDLSVWEPQLAIEVWRSLLRLIDGPTPGGVKALSASDVVQLRAGLGRLSPIALL